MGNLKEGRSTVYNSITSKEKLLRVNADTGLPNVTAKMFRTTFATMMAASNNIDVKKLQAIMGHSKSKTTMDVYAKVERSRLNVDRNVLTDFVRTAAH